MCLDKAVALWQPRACWADRNRLPCPPPPPLLTLCPWENEWPLSETNKIRALVCSLLSGPKQGGTLACSYAFLYMWAFLWVCITRWKACLYVRHLNICVICSRWVCISVDNLCLCGWVFEGVCVSAYAICLRDFLVPPIFWEVTLKPVMSPTRPLFPLLGYTGFSPGVNGFSTEVSSGEPAVPQASPLDSCLRTLTCKRQATERKVKFYGNYCSDFTTLEALPHVSQRNLKVELHLKKKKKKRWITGS